MTDWDKTPRTDACHCGSDQPLDPQTQARIEKQLLLLEQKVAMLQKPTRWLGWLDLYLQLTFAVMLSAASIYVFFLGSIGALTQRTFLAFFYTVSGYVLIAAVFWLFHLHRTMSSKRTRERLLQQLIAQAKIEMAFASRLIRVR